MSVSRLDDFVDFIRNDLEVVIVIVTGDWHCGGDV